MKEQNFLRLLRKDLLAKMKILAIKQITVSKETGISQSVLSSFLACKKSLSAETYNKLCIYVYGSNKNVY